MNLHEKNNKPQYRGNVTNIITISGADASMVTSFVWLEHQGTPSYAVPSFVTYDDHDGVTSGCLLDLSHDGIHSLGYTWTPRQSSEWWLPINLAIDKAGTFTITITAYDAATGTQLCQSISITIIISVNGGNGGTGTQYIYDNIAVDGWYAGQKVPETNFADMVHYDDDQLKTGTDYYLLLSADLTDYGLQYIRDNTLYGQDHTWRLNDSAVHLNFVMEISDPNGINANDVNVSAKGPLYFPSPDLFGIQAKVVQVDSHTVRVVLSREPYNLFNNQKMPIATDPANETKEMFKAFGPTGIDFLKPGDYTIKFYIGDTTNGTVSRNLAPNLMASPSIQKTARVNSNGSGENGGSDEGYLFNAPVLHWSSNVDSNNLVVNASDPVTYAVTTTLTDRGKQLDWSSVNHINDTNWGEGTVPLGGADIFPPDPNGGRPLAHIWVDSV